MTDAERSKSEPSAESEDEPNPVDLAMDLFVFAPLGALLEFSERLPELAKRGRERFETQAPTAKMVGQFAVGAGRKKVEDQLGDVIGKGKTFLQDLGVLPSDPPDPADDGDATDAGAEADGDAAPSGGSIADIIAGYADLTAVNIMPLLSPLDRAQRAAVRAFEAANRSRRTVIARLDQLDDSEHPN